MKRKFVLVITTLLASTGAVWLLHALAPPEYGSGGFTRVARGNVTIARVTDLASRSYYFAGQSENTIILGNTRDPFHVLMLTGKSAETRTIRCDSIVGAAKLHVSNNRFLMHDVYRNLAYTGSLQNMTTDQTYQVTSATVDILPLTRETTIHRQQQYTESRTLIFSKSPGRDSTTFVPERQVDGLFCTDGILLTDPASKRVVYIYYYRNEFIVFDSALNVTARHHTIDTVRRAHITISQLDGNRTTMAAPPTIVNRRATLSGNMLIVQSNIKSLGKEEPSGRHDIVDLYTLDSGQYLRTIYLPPYNDQTLRDIYYHRGSLLALYGNYLVAYRITDH